MHNLYDYHEPSFSAYQKIQNGRKYHLIYTHNYCVSDFQFLDLDTSVREIQCPLSCMGIHLNSFVQSIMAYLQQCLFIEISTKNIIFLRIHHRSVVYLKRSAKPELPLGHG